MEIKYPIWRLYTKFSPLLSQGHYWNIVHIILPIYHIMYTYLLQITITGSDWIYHTPCGQRTRINWQHRLEKTVFDKMCKTFKSLYPTKAVLYLKSCGQGHEVKGQRTVR